MEIIDYPAAHSMDTTWFAIDDAGEVAMLNCHENGALPKSAGYQTSIFDLIDALDKDESGTPIFPAHQEPFPDEPDCTALLQIFTSLPVQEQEALRAAALDITKPVPELSLKAKFVSAVVLLSSPSDIQQFASAYYVIRIDVSSPVYIICAKYSKFLQVMLVGSLVGWRSINDREGRSLDYMGLIDFHGIYYFEPDDDLGFETSVESLCQPMDGPIKYQRVKVPKQPRKGLPASLLAAKVKSNLDRAIELPFIQALPGVRFAQMDLIQIANSVACWDWHETFDPNSGNSVLRKNMAMVHQPASATREAQIALWQQGAAQGDILAQHSLAYACAQAADHEKAFQWYQHAALQALEKPSDSEDMFENGSAAQCCLADLYERGCGVQQDYAKARYWFEKSAALENYVAQFRLGMMYLNGWGQQADRDQALFWLHKAQDHHYEPARTQLSSMVLPDDEAD